MPETDPKNLAFSWSTHFVRSLYEQGVRHAIISPGSRSTALTLALSAHPGFQKHVAIDERSAAFMAMGIGKESGIPAVLVCTSGTAVANYYPAVIEATQSGVPLVIASADRPPHYRSVGASQTIDQLKIFGDYPVFYHETGEPSGSLKARKRLALAARQAVTVSVEQGGVSHLNFAFSKPFEPHSEYLSQTGKENEQLLTHTSVRRPQDTGNMQLSTNFWDDICTYKHPLIIVGPAGPHSDLRFISDLARVLNAPVLAEPGSGIQPSNFTLEGFDGFLRNPENHEVLKADLVLRFAQHPVSKAVNMYLESNEDVHQMVFYDKLAIDGSLTANEFVKLERPLYIPEVTGAAEDNWLSRWKQAEQEFKQLRSSLSKSTSTLTDGFIFSKLSKQLPENSFSMLSSSFPVRDMSLFGDYSGKEMYANRGAAGIDGIISTAIGLSISSQKAGALFIGDIAFLHDSNALLLAKEVQNPLVIVVINNGGGTIFRMLPVHEIRSKYSTYFETPQSVHLKALCQAHQVTHTEVTDKEDLIPAFDTLIRSNGLHVLECKTNADEAMKEREQLWNFKVESNP